MKVSAKAEYACVALVQLALRGSQDAPVTLKALGEEYGISPAFLTQIFLQLKSAGIVRSVRGPAGGYQLARDPADISIGEVIECIDGPPAASSALTSHRRQPLVIALQALWQQVNQAQHDILVRTTLADLVRQTHQAGVGFYQI